MSAHPAEHDDHGSHRSPWFYVGIAVFLGVLTLIELGPLFNYYNLPATVLLLLSCVKFFTVVAFFMHLWDDESIYTRVFGAPLIGSIAMVAVLMVLFHTWAPSPYKDNFAVVERHYENYNGECSSWVNSAITNRPYCASPPIETARVAMYAPHAGSSPSGPAPVDLTGKTDVEKKELLMKRGELIFTSTCASCHQADGKGLPGTYPPLAGSDYLSDAAGHAKIIINGLSGPITVNGAQFNGNMAAFGMLNDYNIAAVATYERNSWGNALGVVLPEDVQGAR